MIVSSYKIHNHKYLPAEELWLWVLGLVAIPYWTNIIRTGSSGGFTLSSAANAILENGAFDVCAWALVLMRICALPRTNPASGGQIVWTILTAFVVLVPARLASAVGLAMAGAMLFRTGRANDGARQISLVLFALAIEILWISPLFGPLHVMIGGLDASAATAILGLVGYSAIHHANFVDNLTTGFGIAIWPYCSSTMPLAGVSLAFLVTVFYRAQAPRPSHLPWLAASLLTSVALTELRLAILATTNDNYDWWHAGPGMTIYTLCALVPAIVFPILATPVPSARRSPSTAGATP